MFLAQHILYHRPCNLHTASSRPSSTKVNAASTGGPPLLIIKARQQAPPFPKGNLHCRPFSTTSHVVSTAGSPITSHDASTYASYLSEAMLQAQQGESSRKGHAASTEGPSLPKPTLLDQQTVEALYHKDCCQQTRLSFTSHHTASTAGSPIPQGMLSAQLAILYHQPCC